MIQELRQDWWSRRLVFARINVDGGYEPGNVHWRQAVNEHEANIGIEELDDDEPVRLPMSRDHYRKRMKQPTADLRRLFDVWLRMMYRGGLHQGLRLEKSKWVTSTPFSEEFDPPRDSNPFRWN